MSRMHREIRSCMRDLKTLEGGAVSAQFSFPESFAGFQGHFDGQPVLPGICSLQAVVVMFEACYQKRVRLKEVKNAKFTAPVAPEETILITANPAPLKEGCIFVKVSVEGEGKKIALLQLLLEAETLLPEEVL